MSPGRTPRFHGLSAGSATSSTTYAALAVDGVIFVATSCRHLDAGAPDGMPRTLTGGASSPRAIAAQNWIGAACSGIHTARTVPSGVSMVSIAVFTPATLHRATEVPGA